ncbi:MAG: GWxTD domain-containing protein [Calditrichae bacterium]|nr:GWxTD domain-containing protein [Calditrichia bacterium]
MIKASIFRAVLLCLSIVTFLHSQYFEESKYSGVGLPFFELSLNRQFDSDYNTSRLLVFAQVVYDDLTFLKSDTSGYYSELEWLVAVYDDDEKLIFSRTISDNIHLKNYKETNSRDLTASLKTDLALKEGEYQILVRAVDLNTNQSAQRRIEIEIPEYYDEDISLSDIMFLKSVVYDSSGRIVDYDPILSNNFTVKKGYFYIYFNVYSKTIDKNAQIDYSFKNSEKKVEFDTVTTKAVKSHITSHILKVDKNIFNDNTYNLNISVDIDGNDAETSKVLTFYWKLVPNTATDIDLALNQMVYILQPDSLSYYLDADLKSKQEFFKRFWKERDPNPDTKKNELMDEYFKRINYANENYSGLATDGWLTDRGRILIKFGPPDDIERHPFELETRPYEIWRYYSLRKVFLFQDYTGFGDFRLHPDYINVEYQ